MESTEFSEYVHKQLQHPDFAAEYLTASYEDGSIESFLYALKQVIQVLGGIGKFSVDTKLGRQNMYRMLSKKGNPTLRSLDTLLEQAGLRLAFLPRKRR